MPAKYVRSAHRARVNGVFDDVTKPLSVSNVRRIKAPCISELEKGQIRVSTRTTDRVQSLSGGGAMTMARVCHVTNNDIAAYVRRFRHASPREPNGNTQCARAFNRSARVPVTHAITFANINDTGTERGN
jgi:hypothetical protein